MIVQAQNNHLCSIAQNVKFVLFILQIRTNYQNAYISVQYGSSSWHCISRPPEHSGVGLQNAERDVWDDPPMGENSNAL